MTQTLLERQKEVVEEINYYLQSGGLFNPELANHDEVRNLLIQARDVIKQANET